MPALAALIPALFGALAGFLAKMFAVRLALRVSAVAALVACSALLMTTFNGVVAPLVAQAFSTQYGQFLGLAFPPVAGTCLAGIAAVWAACGLYKWQERVILVTAGM
jgi:hypothetical protein